VTAACDTARVCPRTEHRSPGHDKERSRGKGSSCGGCRGCHSRCCCGWRQCFGLHRWRRGRRFHCRRLDGSRRWLHPRSRECRPGYRCYWQPRCGCRSAHCCRSRWNSGGYNIRAGSLSCGSSRRGRRAQGRRPGCGWSDSCCTQNSWCFASNCWRRGCSGWLHRQCGENSHGRSSTCRWQRSQIYWPSTQAQCWQSGRGDKQAVKRWACSSCA
jgi:hypothetical protein